MSNLIKHQKTAMTAYSPPNIEFTGIGEEPILGATIDADDPVKCGVINALAGLGAFAGTMLLGGSVVGSFLVLAGSGLIVLNDFAYSIKNGKIKNAADDDEPEPPVKKTIPAPKPTPDPVDEDESEPVPNEFDEEPKNVIKPAQGYEVVDVPKLMVQDLYSYAIIGPSGSGKGILLSSFVRELKKSRPDITILLLDPKNDPKESGYWDGVVDIWHRGDFDEMEISEKSDWVNDGLDKIKSVKGARLAIVDEATMLMGFLQNFDRTTHNRIKDFITATASSGNSREKYAFIVGHSPNLGDYGISGGQMASFRKLYIATQDESALAQLGQTTLTGSKFSDNAIDEILAIANQSPVKRAIFVGTKRCWYPMDRLENYSGYDRDSKQFIGEKPAQPTDKKFEAPPSPWDDTPVMNTNEGSIVVDTNYQQFVKKLTDAFTRAKAAGKNVDLMTAEKIYNSSVAKEHGLTLQQCEKALSEVRANV